MKLLVCYLTFISALTRFAASTENPITQVGSCTSVPSQSTFDMNKYLGTWYEIQRFPDPYEQGKCQTAEYSLNANGNMNVVNSLIRTDGTPASITGEAQVKDSSVPAVLSVTFPTMSLTGEYRIVETDYTQYSLVTSCYDYGSFHMEFAWILSRTRTLPTATVDRLKALLAKTDFPVSRFEAADQNGCA